MPTFQAPGVGDSIEKWEEWIETYLQQLPNTDDDYNDKLLVDRKFNTYKENEIRGFGTNWNTALKWGNDKKFITIMENNWKYATYLCLKGVKPKSFDRKAYL